MTARHDEGARTPGADRPPGSVSGRGQHGVDRLLVLVARGDSDAFAVLYEQVAGTVYGLVRRMAGDPARAQDVTRDVLAEVWHTASGFRPADGSGMSWILAIARRRAVAQVRAERKAEGRRGIKRSQAAQVVKQVADQAGLTLPAPPGAQPAPPDALPARPGAGPGAPSGPGAQSQPNGLASLPEPQRQALVLVLYGGYTQGQVAGLLGVRSGTVAAWLRDGLPRLS